MKKVVLIVIILLLFYNIVLSVGFWTISSKIEKIQSEITIIKKHLNY